MRSPKSDPPRSSHGQAAQRADAAAKAIIAAETDARRAQVARLKAARLERDAALADLPPAPKPVRKSGRK
ncbi:hypothetical protein CESP606_08450 [Cereibacter sphaeroides]|jgi:hypothetical protein|uniref:hypothetical protein n=1 Tax=Cereibacter sphaeroides TaxID=1063 RepID=UPI0002D97C78|nr:hypothetical protein [Cereibacter sphaeroides]AMJ49555.1 hypothetical protein APX01_18585 [Cereibacter sphaeroides]ANS36268.1 hypothetical protein A3858_18590 [Cereibacter sphaeroides]ATN65325.1 hypothetical protein A3857_18615 [Cereibacter sphaeroides]QJC85836.1 hypothetical protein HGN32_16625 [Cereibacter sphaeroides]GEM95307.1 hypothetical protein RSP03_43740 [Cereibacter sphaeroides]